MENDPTEENDIIEREYGLKIYINSLKEMDFKKYMDPFSPVKDIINFQED